MYTVISGPQTVEEMYCQRVSYKQQRTLSNQSTIYFIKAFCIIWHPDSDIAGMSWYSQALVKTSQKLEWSDTI